MSDDYEIDDLHCPACGNPVTHSRHCSGIHCDDGYIDEYEDDPINFAPGEEYTVCDECHGHGTERWCPKCGADYWLAKAKGLKTGELQQCRACRGSGNAEHSQCEVCSGAGWVRMTEAAAARDDEISGSIEEPGGTVHSDADPGL